MTKPTPTIRARDVAGDIASGMDASSLRSKYRLTPAGLEKALHKLLELNAVSASDVERLRPREAVLENEASQERHGSAAVDEKLPHEEHDLSTVETPNTKGPPADPIADHTADESPPPEASPAAPKRNLRDDASQRYSLSEGSAYEAAGEQTHWGIKLYGKLTADRETFCTNLAAILAINRTEAEVLLDNAPALIKSGLSQEKAERLRGVLTSIGALSLTVETEASVEPTDSLTPLPAPEFALLMKREHLKPVAGLLPENLRASFIALLAVIMALAIGAGILIRKTSYVRSGQGSAGAMSQSVPEDPTAQKEVIQQEEMQQYTDLEAARLEGKAARLQERLQQHMETYRTLKSARSINFGELQRVDFEVSKAQRDYQTAIRELRNAKRRQSILNRGKTPPPQ